MDVKQILESPELMEVGRKAIEDVLIDYRDSRISMPMFGNGLVVREKDGKPSPIIRLSTLEGLRVALKAWAAEKLTEEDRTDAATEKR